jgi:hypothetical protein
MKSLLFNQDIRPISLSPRQQALHFIANEELMTRKNVFISRRKDGNSRTALITQDVILDILLIFGELITSGRKFF